MFQDRQISVSWLGNYAFSFFLDFLLTSIEITNQFFFAFNQVYNSTYGDGGQRGEFLGQCAFVHVILTCRFAGVCCSC